MAACEGSRRQASISERYEIGACILGGGGGGGGINVDVEVRVSQAAFSSSRLGTVSQRRHRV